MTIDQTLVTEAPPSSLDISLHVTDAETIAALAKHDEGAERETFALAALRVGVIALRHAGGALDERAIRDAGANLLRDVRAALEKHHGDVTGELGRELRNYFDRNEGHLPASLERALGSNGQLQTLLRAHVDGDTSALARTLTTHIGTDSPLFKLLSPDQQGGLLARIEQAVHEQLEVQRQIFVSEFDLNRPESSLCRLIEQVRAGSSGAVTSIDQTVTELKREFSLDTEGSCLARLKSLVETQVEALAASQGEFKERVLAALEGLKSHRAVVERTTLKGTPFEEALENLLNRESRRAGETLEDTRKKTGVISRCFTGDYVLCLGPDSAAPGERIVVEAKNDQSYSDADAQEEIARGRTNRGAQCGIFIRAKSVAGKALPWRRVGVDFFVVWDENDPATDVWVIAAMEAARALVIRATRASSSDAATWNGVDKELAAAESQVRKLAEIRTRADTMRGASADVSELAEDLSAQFSKRLSALRELLQDLRRSAPS